MPEIETIVLRALTSDLEYTRKVIPHLNKVFFGSKDQQAVYLIIDQYFRKYHKCPTREVLDIEIDKLTNLNEQLYKDTKKLVDEVFEEKETAETQWLVDTTETFVKDKSLYNAMTKCLSIMKGNEEKLSTTAIPEIFREALAVGFDNDLGHDYENDSDKQFEYYHSDIVRIPFDVQILNDITNGGVPRKTLSLLVAGTHVGKTLTKCALAAGFYMQGANVLYITMEEDEFSLRQRIDANLLNINMADFKDLDASLYFPALKKIHARTKGILKIKEYSNGAGSAAKFESYIKELALKESFVPDIVFVDYLNVCKSDTVRNKDNTNVYYKAISEELRGVAQRTNTSFWSSVQLNRGGAQDSDPDMTDVASSWDSVFVGDFVAILTAPDELRNKNLMMWKQQKNRYRNMNYKKKFVTGADPYKMRIYDVEENAQPKPDIDAPVFDNTETGQKISDKAKKFAAFT